MLEIEIKCPVSDFCRLRERLQSWGAVAGDLLQEVDHYFNAPDRDFARSDEALRVRRIGSSSRVTYKGPRREGSTKIRTEIEVGLAEGNQPAEDFCRLLSCLGYRPVAIVCKQRAIYKLQREEFALQVCLDEVAEVGRFVEIEIVAPEKCLARARQVLQEIAAELELKDFERRSYLEMLLLRKTQGQPG